MNSWRKTALSVVVGAPASLLVLLCCGLPLAWMCLQVAANPVVWHDLQLSSFRFWLLARTVGYNVGVGVLATAMALPAAIVLGRGRGLWAKVLWCILPAALLMPSLAYAYGWSQFMVLNRERFEAIGIVFAPGGPADVLRCVWTLAAWLWPVPAGLIGLALRRMDTAVQQHALLDGTLWRVTFRQLVGPIVASAAIVTMLATQEFAVYEPTGITVVATEVRMVFESGAFSGIGGLAGGVSPDQAARAAAAIATAIPLLLTTIALAALAAWGATRRGAADAIAQVDWPRRLSAPVWTYLAAGVLVALTVAVPVGSLALSLRSAFSPARIWAQFGDEIGGAAMLGMIAAAAALALAVAAAGQWRSRRLALATVSFLVGGQLLAIALIRIYNRPHLAWAYDNFPVPVMAYLGRFAWLPLLAARGTWTKPWRELRDMAASDGAGPLATVRHVVWPLAWPMLVASALLVGALSLNEVPATVILQPLNPQVLTPMVMSWVHIQRYDAMIEASLTMLAVVLLPAGAAVAMLAWAAGKARAVVRMGAGVRNDRH